MATVQLIDQETDAASISWSTSGAVVTAESESVLCGGVDIVCASCVRYILYIISPREVAENFTRTKILPQYALQQSPLTYLVLLTGDPVYSVAVVFYTFTSGSCT